jgi:glycosyltransferase involved in cell wall biosynthesis
MKIKVKYILTHTIQYFVPLIQRLARCEEIELKVIFGTDAGSASYFDQGFGRQITWDLPLLEGYDYSVLRPGAPLGKGLMGVRGDGVTRFLSPRDTDVIIVHGWSSHLNFTAIMAGLARGIPVLYRADTHARVKSRSAFKHIKPLVINPLFRRFAGLLAIGTWNRQYYLGLGVKPERIFHVPYSIDTDLFQRGAPDPADSRARKQAIGLAPGSFRVIFSGKFMALKRAEDIIEAVARMPSCRRTEVIFVGDGALRPSLEKLARDKGVRAHFLGFCNQQELPALYRLADVIVLPSDDEAWGLVINEAMTCGLAALVSDMVGCGPDLVIEGKTGSIFKVGDTEAMARYLEKMATDPEYLQGLKQGALEHIKAFSIDRTLEGYLEAIRTVRARKAGA